MGRKSKPWSAHMRKHLPLLFIAMLLAPIALQINTTIALQINTTPVTLDTFNDKPFTIMVYGVKKGSKWSPIQWAYQNIYN